MAVVERLEISRPLTPEVARDRFEAHKKKTAKRLMDGAASWAEASGELIHLDRPDATEFVKSIQNDLGEQVGIFSGCVDAWFENGSHPAPGYTWRITVILRKSRMYDLERRFLAAYFRHFYTVRGSSRDYDLGVRAIKVGVDIPAAPSKI